MTHGLWVRGLVEKHRKLLVRIAPEFCALVGEHAGKFAGQIGAQVHTNLSTMNAYSWKNVDSGEKETIIQNVADQFDIKGEFPVDEGARAFTGFLGSIARKPHICPIRYLNWRDMTEELKEECWRLVERKYADPTNPIAYVGLKTFTLQKIGKVWRDHKCRLKMAHYIPHPRNKAQVKSNRPKGCIPEDWDVLVDHCKATLELEGRLHVLESVDDTSGSIAWAPDDVFAKVMGKERKGRIRGVGFGPNPSG
nr:hypothetical protein CFP56_14991 [Quercus suber]